VQNGDDADLGTEVLACHAQEQLPGRDRRAGMRENQSDRLYPRVSEIDHVFEVELQRIVDELIRSPRDVVDRLTAILGEYVQ